MQHSRPSGEGGTTPRALVVGVGNADRGDDAAGLRVAEALATDPPPGVLVRALRGDLTTLIDLMDGMDRVVVVDAMRGGGRPGEVRRVDLTADTPAAALAGFVSTHAFGLAGAMALADALGRRPARVTVIGIEATGFAHGAALSAPVAAAIAEVVHQVRVAISSWGSR